MTETNPPRLFGQCRPTAVIPEQKPPKLEAIIVLTTGQCVAALVDLVIYAQAEEVSKFAGLFKQCRLRKTKIIVGANDGIRERVAVARLNFLSTFAPGSILERDCILHTVSPCSMLRSAPIKPVEVVRGFVTQPPKFLNSIGVIDVHPSSIGMTGRRPWRWRRSWCCIR